MTESKWTDGPWYVSLGTVVDGEGLAVADCNYGPSVDHNARLIAAAPDLAEACEAAELFMRDVGSQSKALQLVRAALRKAKGEA